MPLNPRRVQLTIPMNDGLRPPATVTGVFAVFSQRAAVTIPAVALLRTVPRRRLPGSG